MKISMTMQGAVSYARSLHRDIGFHFVTRVLDYPAKYVIGNDGLQDSKMESVQCAYVEPLVALVKAVQRRRKFIVTVKEVDLSVGVLAIARVVKGNILEIRVQKGLTYCVKRFAILKELLHYYEADLASSDTSEDFLYEAICSSMRCRFARSDVYAKIHVEELCYYAAIEVLLYWGENGAGRESLIKLRNDKKMPEYFIACAFRTPLSIVQYFFEDNSRYSELSYALNLNCSV